MGRAVGDTGFGADGGSPSRKPTHGGAGYPRRRWRGDEANGRDGARWLPTPDGDRTRRASGSCRKGNITLMCALIKNPRHCPESSGSMLVTIRRTQVDTAGSLGPSGGSNRCGIAGSTLNAASRIHRRGVGASPAMHSSPWDVSFPCGDHVLLRRTYRLKSWPTIANPRLQHGRSMYDQPSSARPYE